MIAAATTRVVILSQIRHVEREIVRSCESLIKCGSIEIVSLGRDVATWTSKEATSKLRDADVVVGDPPTFVQFVEKCEHLKWFQSTYAGCDALLNSEKRDYVVARLGGSVFGVPMQEYCVLHIIGRERDFAGDTMRQRRRVWSPIGQTSYRTMDELTLGIMGMGEIGLDVARSAKAMGMKRIIGLKRQITTEDQNVASAAGVSEMTTLDDLPNHLSKSDYVLNLLPSNSATRNILSLDMLAHCGGGTVIINAGRGDIFPDDGTTVIEALDRDYLSHVVLDVFRNEPLEQTSPLWTHKRVTITPHTAALSSPRDVGRVFAGNMARYLNEELLLDTFEWAREY